MTANVETLAYNKVNGVPWHGEGKALEKAATADEMYEASGLDWEVVKSPLLTYGTGSSSSALLAVNDRVAMLRTSDNRVLGTVGATYTPIQNREMFDFAEALMKTGETVLFETAGSLNNGRVVFAEAIVPERGITIDGDPQGKIMPYLVLNTGHDGLRAFQATFTPVRVVCSNTLAMALSGARNLYVIRHTVNSGDRIADARATLRLNVEYMEQIKTVSEALIKRSMSIKDILAATETLIPSMGETPEKSVKAGRQRDEIVALYRNSANLDGVPESAYRFVQAVAEYSDHVRTYRGTKKGNAADARTLAILDGTAAKLKTRALAIVMPQAAKRGAGGRFVKASN
jgi:phage/plasmid-like protein (TIGR03299 family)